MWCFFFYGWVTVSTCFQCVVCRGVVTAMEWLGVEISPLCFYSDITLRIGLRRGPGRAHIRTKCNTKTFLLLLLCPILGHLHCQCSMSVESSPCSQTLLSMEVGAVVGVLSFQAADAFVSLAGHMALSLTLGLKCVCSLSLCSYCFSVCGGSSDWRLLLTLQPRPPGGKDEAH